MWYPPQISSPWCLSRWQRPCLLARNIPCLFSWIFLDRSLVDRDDTYPSSLGERSLTRLALPTCLSFVLKGFCWCLMTFCLQVQRSSMHRCCYLFSSIYIFSAAAWHPLSQDFCTTAWVGLDTHREAFDGVRSLLRIAGSLFGEICIFQRFSIPFYLTQNCLCWNLGFVIMYLLFGIAKE